MGKVATRFVAKSESGQGWPVWDRKAKKWWGQAFAHYPEQLLSELNGEKRREKLAELTKQSRRKQ